MASLLGPKSYSLFAVPAGVSEVPIDDIVQPSEDLTFLAPKSIEPNEYWRFRDKEAKLPALGRCFVQSATATHLGGNLDCKGRLIKTYLKPVDGKKPEKHDLFNFSSKRFRPKMMSATTVISMTAGWQNMFYHWVHEVLPRFALIKDLEGQIYIDQGQRFQKESLDFLGIDPSRIIDAAQFQGVEAKELIIPAIPHIPSPWSCNFLRSHVAVQKQVRRLYISRKDADKRRVLNEEELLPILERHGFEVWTLSGLSFAEQVQLFASSEIVVGPHGAGFSHLAFCQEGTPFLELYAPAYVNVCYWHLACAAKLPYHYMFSEGERYPEFFDPKLDPDLEVDPKKFEEALKLALADRQSR